MKLLLFHKKKAQAAHKKIIIIIFRKLDLCDCLKKDDTGFEMDTNTKNHA